MKKLSSKQVITLVAGLSIIVLSGVLFARERLTKSEYPKNNEGEYVIETSATDSKEAPNNNSNDEQAVQQTNTPGDPQKAIDNTTSASTLTAPSGNFVSSHRVTTSTTIESVCVTTPGANCKIVLSMNGSTKTLNEKKADIYGTASWVWQPQKIGITGGSWQIKAVATLNEKSKETVDAMNLEVN